MPFGCSFRQLSPLERRHGQQGASTLGVGELGKPIAFRRFAQAIFTGFHVLPQVEIRWRQSHANPASWPYLHWLSPAVSEADVVLELVEGGIAGAELVADALDRRPDVCPKAIVAASGDKAFVAQAIVDRAVGHKAADVRHQQMDLYLPPGRSTAIRSGQQVGQPIPRSGDRVAVALKCLGPPGRDLRPSRRWKSVTACVGQPLFERLFDACLGILTIDTPWSSTVVKPDRPSRRPTRQWRSTV